MGWLGNWQNNRFGTSTSVSSIFPCQSDSLANLDVDQGQQTSTFTSKKEHEVRKLYSEMLFWVPYNNFRKHKNGYQFQTPDFMAGMGGIFQLAQSKSRILAELGIWANIQTNSTFNRKRPLHLGFFLTELSMTVFSYIAYL